MRTPKNRLHDLEQKLQRRPVQKETPAEGKKHKPGQSASVEAMSFDNNEPIDLRYDQKADGYVPSSPTYATAHSLTPDLRSDAEAFEIEPFDEIHPVPPTPANTNSPGSAPVTPDSAGSPARAFEIDTPVVEKAVSVPDKKTTESEDFLENLQAISRGEKTYDGDRKQVIDVSTSAPKTETAKVKAEPPLPPIQAEVVSPATSTPTKSANPPAQAFEIDTPAVKRESSPPEEVVTEDDFLEDLQAILNGEKTYDGDRKQTVNTSTSAPNVEQLSVSSSPSPAPVEPPKQTSPHDVFDRMAQGVPPEPKAPTPTYSNAHSVFDRMGKNMAFANSFDLGTISLQQRFDEFDRILEAEDHNSLSHSSGLLEEHQPYAYQSALTTTEQLKKVAGDTESYKLSSTYRSIVNNLSEYEKLSKKYSERSAKYEKELKKLSDSVVLEKLAVLLRVNGEIATWMNKHKNDSKQARREALQELQVQLNNEIGEITQTIVRNGGVLPDNLVQFLLKQNSFKPQTVLLSYLMEKVISIYEVDKISKSNFNEELVKFLIPDNDLVGSSSLALHTKGGSGNISLEVDLGKIISPFLEASIEIKAGAKLADSQLILLECQSPSSSSDLSIKRYCFMDMNGRYREANFGVTFSIGVEAETPSASNIVDKLEIASLSINPQVVPSASASASASASVGGGVTGTWLQVSNSSPFYFNFVAEVTDRLVDTIVNDGQETKLQKAKDDAKDKNVTVSSEDEVFLSLFSHAYNGDAEIGAEASANAAVAPTKSAEANVEVKAGIHGSAKFSRYTYQTKLSNNTFKTQHTTMFFKQISAKFEGSASAKAQLEAINIETKRQFEERYDFLNSIYYESTIAYWNKPTEDAPKLLEKSGFGVGHFLVPETLIKNLYRGPHADENYVAALAKTLKVSSELLKQFLVKHSDIAQDIAGSNDGGKIFIESTFVPKSSITLVLKGNVPDASVFKELSNSNNLVLQSLRLRKTVEGEKRSYKAGFKLGLNLKVVKLGIDLGRLEDASSLKLSDLIVEWYDENQQADQPAPQNYVPSSCLIM